MTPRWRSLVRLTVWLLLGVCLCGSLADIIHRLRRPAAPAYLAGWREAARTVCSGTVGVWCENAREPAPLDRARLMAVNWELRPQAAVPCDGHGAFASVKHLIVTSSCRSATRDRLMTEGWTLGWANDFATVWTHSPEELRPPRSPHAVGWAREAIGVGVVVLLAAVLLYPLKDDGWTSERRTLFEAGMIFLILSAITVIHTVQPPNGLGVQAGKAALWFAAGGWPDGFFTRPEFAVYQPSYPPGLTMLSGLAMIVSGGAGERLVQLIVPAAVGGLYLALVQPGTGWHARLAAVAFVLAPISLRMTAGFYAEPLAAMLLAVGWRCVRKGRILVGWMVLGNAGLFRTEGFILAGILFSLERLRLGITRTTVMSGLLAFGPSVLWHVLVRLLGGSVYDFDFCSVPDLGRIVSAGGEVLSCLGAGFRSLGGGPLLALGLALGWQSQSDCGRHMLGCPVAVLSVAFMLVLFGFCTSAHLPWMLSTYLPRLLWTAMVLELQESSVRNRPSGFSGGAILIR